jgi:hypothetical protein
MLKQNTKWGFCTQKVEVIYLEEVRYGRYSKLCEETGIWPSYLEKRTCGVDDNAGSNATSTIHQSQRGAAVG